MSKYSVDFDDEADDQEQQTVVNPQPQINAPQSETNKYSVDFETGVASGST